jgi:hypothetical protein
MTTEAKEVTLKILDFILESNNLAWGIKIRPYDWVVVWFEEGMAR